MRKDKFYEVVKSYLHSIYAKNLKEIEIDQISKKICSLFVNNKIPQKSLWSEEDFFLITYADTIKKKKVKNLISLGNFLNKYCKEFSFVHVLPFFPYSSDDGFAVKDFKKVNSEHGDWDDFKKISSSFKSYPYLLGLDIFIVVGVLGIMPVFRTPFHQLILLLDIWLLNIF